MAIRRKNFGKKPTNRDGRRAPRKTRRRVASSDNSTAIAIGVSAVIVAFVVILSLATTGAGGLSRRQSAKPWEDNAKVSEYANRLIKIRMNEADPNRTFGPKTTARITKNMEAQYRTRAKLILYLEYELSKKAKGEVYRFAREELIRLAMVGIYVEDMNDPRFHRVWEADINQAVKNAHRKVEVGRVLDRAGRR